MSMRTQDEQREAVQRAVMRGECAEAGPWGAVCTLDPRHRYSDYDGSLDVSFNHHWIDDMEVPLENHPYDCTCPDHATAGAHWAVLRTPDGLVYAQGNCWCDQQPDTRHQIGVRP